MKAWAPQGIEIAPASDFGGLRGPDPSPASIFSKISSFRKSGCMHQGCLDAYNFLDSQRPDAIATANESPHTGGHDNLDSFSNSIVFGHGNQTQRSKTPGLYDHRSWSNRPCRRYYSTVQPLYESCEMKRGRRKALKSRQRAILVDLDA